jgi:hypothetical protein
MVEMKTTSKGRRPQNIKSRISQQPLMRSFFNFQLKPMGPSQNKRLLEMKMTSKYLKRNISATTDQIFLMQCKALGLNCNGYHSCHQGTDGAS